MSEWEPPVWEPEGKWEWENGGDSEDHETFDRVFGSPRRGGVGGSASGPRHRKRQHHRTAAHPGNAEDGWQSANCTADQPTPGEFCSPETPNLYFKQAGGHPPTGFTQYTSSTKKSSQA